LTHVNELGSANSRELHYYLPKNDFIMTVEMERTKKTPGELWKGNEAAIKGYAALLGIEEKEIVQLESTVFKVKNATMERTTSVDLACLYRIDPKAGFLRKRTVSMKWGPAGEGFGGSMTDESQAWTVVTEAVKLTASVASIAVGKSISDTDQQTLIAKLTADGQPIALVVKEILRIRAVKQAHLEKPTPGLTKEALAFVIEQLETQEKKHMAQLFGTIKKEMAPVAFHIPGDKFLGTAGELKVFALYKSGVKILVSQDGSTVRTDGRFNTVVDPPGNELGAIKVKWKSNGVTTTTTKPPAEPTPIKGAAIAYRIPAICTFTADLAMNDTLPKDLFVMRTELAQAGVVQYLPKVKELEFEMHQGLGSLSSVKLSNRRLDLSGAGDAGAAGKGLSDALKKPDPRDKLILDLEKDAKIKELKEKLAKEPE
jgi:hypothetical protein